MFIGTHKIPAGRAHVSSGHGRPGVRAGKDRTRGRGGKKLPAEQRGKDAGDLTHVAQVEVTTPRVVTGHVPLVQPGRWNVTGAVSAANEQRQGLPSETEHRRYPVR